MYAQNDLWGKIKIPTWMNQEPDGNAACINLDYLTDMEVASSLTVSGNALTISPSDSVTTTTTGSGDDTVVTIDFSDRDVPDKGKIIFNATQGGTNGVWHFVYSGVADVKVALPSGTVIAKFGRTIGT